MKVLCIDEPKFNRTPGEATRMSTPIQTVQVGSIYTVRDVREYDGMSYYSLMEFEAHYYFTVTIFAPLSDIDELELINAREETFA